MAIASDIVVQRKVGALVQLPFASGIAKIGIVGRSRGKNTLDTEQITRSSTGDTDSFPVTTESPIRSLSKAVGDSLTAAENEEFYPNIHFLVKYGNTILDPTNFGTNDDPSTLTLDWSAAPPLVPPTVGDATLLTSTTGGFASATTVYYSITVIDHNGSESNIGSITKVEMSDPSPNFWQVQLAWRLVEYSSGYKVYRGVLADGSDLEKIADIADKSTVTLTDDNLVASGSPPTTNTTIAKPKDAETYTITYYYAVITTQTYMEFTNVEAVIEEHGIGSELSNVAKLYMNPEFNNAPVIATIVPESTNYNSYIDAANLFQENHVQFITVLYAGTVNLSTFTTNMTPIYNLAASLSNPTQGQKECYAIFALPYKAGWTVNDCNTLCTAFQATASEGKRAFFGVPAGFEVSVSSWTDENGEAQSDYTITDPAGIDITQLVMSGAAVARYCGFRDPAMPLTEKDVVGFTFKGRNFTNQQIEQLRGFGCMVIENNNSVAVVSQSINMSHPVLGIEDGEMNICVTEDWMKYDLRNRLRSYRGKKMLGRILRAAQNTLTEALRQYVDNLRIAYFDAASVSVTQDANQRDRLKGYFKYMPIYPINQIQVEYEFTFVVL